MPRNPRKTRKLYGKKRRTLKGKKMRGGFTKQEALDNLAAHDVTMDNLIHRIFREGTKKYAEGRYGRYDYYVMNIGNFTYKAQGHVNISIFAKPLGEDDSQYMEIHWFSDH
jgi:hypothetical protein